MDDIVGRLQSCFSPHQIDVIIGSLLGDARLECRSVGIRHPVTARLRIHQGDKQKEYVFWKYDIFKEFVLEPPRRIMVWYDKQREHRHYSWYFHTKSLEELGWIHEWIYHDNKKVFPENIENLITPKMLAVWFMDDGSNTVKSFTLSTHCFSYEEQVRIVRLLQNRFDISATIVKDRTKLKIRIGYKEYEKFANIVRPFIIPSMSYKIVDPRNDLLDLNRAEIESTKLLLSI